MDRCTGCDNITEIMLKTAFNKIQIQRKTPYFDHNAYRVLTDRTYAVKQTNVLINQIRDLSS